MGMARSPASARIANAREPAAPRAREATNGRSTRERILASAERLFAEHGYNDVTMPMIAHASGITAGAIYKHFAGKAELFFHVVRQAVVSTPVTAAAEGPPG